MVKHSSNMKFIKAMFLFIIFGLAGTKLVHAATELCHIPPNGTVRCFVNRDFPSLRSMITNITNIRTTGDPSVTVVHYGWFGEKERTDLSPNHRLPNAWIVVPAGDIWAINRSNHPATIELKYRPQCVTAC